MYIKSYAVTYTNDLLYKGRKHLIFYRELNEKLYLFLSNIYLSTQKKIHPPIRLAIIVFHIALNDIYFKHKYKIGLDNCHLIKYKKNFFIYLTPYSLYQLNQVLNLLCGNPIHGSQSRYILQDRIRAQRA